MKTIILFLLFSGSLSLKGTGHDTETPVFTENKGQVEDQNGHLRRDILFSAHQKDLGVFLRKNGVTYQLSKQLKKALIRSRHHHFQPNQGSSSEILIRRVELDWIGCNQQPEVTAEDPLSEKLNYYTRGNPAGITGINSYKNIWYKNVYENIDLHYYQCEAGIKYDFIVHAGADYKKIIMKISGADHIEITNDGAVRITTGNGVIVEEAPVVYQAGQKLASAWILKNDLISFSIKNHDPALPLLIDPVTRLLATYYGGNMDDGIYAGETDSNGDLLVAGASSSAGASIIATTGSYQQTLGGFEDAFIARFNSNGVRLWATYYGGSGIEAITALAIDGGGNIVCTGTSDGASGSVMTSSGAFQASHGGGVSDIFLVKFSSAGVRIWSTYYGGPGMEQIMTCYVDGMNEIIVAGNMHSSSAAVMSSNGAHQTTAGGARDAFLAKFDVNGSRIWGTVYGGTGDDWISSCVTNSLNEIYVAGFSKSQGAGVIATPGSFQPTNGGVGSGDAFLAKFSPSGIRQWGTYFGGNQYDQAFSMDLLPNGEIVIAGESMSAGLATPGTYNLTYSGGIDVFLARFDDNGNRIWCTYYGGTGTEFLYTCRTDASSNIFIAGTTSSSTGSQIATTGNYQTTYGGGGTDAFLAAFSPSGQRLWATYYGGSSSEVSYAAVEPSGDVYLIGVTDSQNSSFHSQGSAHQSLFGGGGTDGFIAKFGGCTMPALPSISTIPTHGLSCSAKTVTITTISPNTTWYYSATGGTAIAITNTFVSPPLAGGQYTWYAEAFDCMTNNSRVPVTFTVVATPTLLLGSADSVLCAGEIVQLNAQGASSYYWSGPGIGAIATGPLLMVNPASTTSYTVMGFNGQCGSTATITQLVDPCNSTDDPVVTSSNVRIFPNPAHEKIFIETDEPSEMEIRTLLGEQLEYKSARKGINTFDLPAASGIYIIIVKNSTGIQNRRIIKQ